MNINEVKISGELSNDPILGTSKTGNSYAIFTVIGSTKSRMSKPFYMKVMMFNDNANKLEGSKKGDIVTVVGSLESSLKTDKDKQAVLTSTNKKIYEFSINATDVAISSKGVTVVEPSVNSGVVLR